MAKKSQHPFVFVHGMMGWGEDKKLTRVLPYWGMVTGNYLKRMQKMGYEAYAPSVSPLGSAWDRACELYAQLTGTRVDYGAAHSKKYGHDRYGMTFTKPFVPDWTPERSIHLLGHSFGGPTLRMFAELMTNGSEEERAATPEAELSPLFKGGQGNLIKSLTTISGPFDGITFPHAMPFTVHYILTYGILAVASIIGNVGTGHVYDFKMSQWGITEEEGKPRSLKNALNIPKMIHFAKAQDNVFPDIHIDRAAELNKMLHTPDAYCFSVTGRLRRSPTRLANSRSRPLPASKLTTSGAPTTALSPSTPAAARARSPGSGGPRKKTSPLRRASGTPCPLPKETTAPSSAAPSPSLAKRAPRSSAAPTTSGWTTWTTFRTKAAARLAALPTHCSAHALLCPRTASEAVLRSNSIINAKSPVQSEPFSLSCTGDFLFFPFSTAPSD